MYKNSWNQCTDTVCWGGIMIIQRIKAFLGQDQERKTASQESSLTPQGAAPLGCSSPAGTKGKKKLETILR